MKQIYTLLVIFLLVGMQKSYGQLHDFDSLFSANQEFKSIASEILETFDLFEGDELIKISIISDFKHLSKNKFKDEYQPAQLKYYFNDSVIVNREIKIKARGNFRRKTCYYPPITLNFPKKKAALKQLQEFDKLKFVDNCKGGDNNEQYILSEYYAYKIYNQLTPYSFRVRLLEVEFVDTGRKNKTRTNNAFIIEDVGNMAKRLNAINFKRKNVHSERTNRELASLMYVFQFMIGNTDWSIPVLHNMKLIKVNEVKMPEPIAVPYDFDYSGIVNTSYAIPNDNLPIESVKERYYMGFCRTREELQPIFDLFEENKEEIYQLYNTSEYLSERNRNRTINYIDGFYKIIDSEGYIRQMILNNCRK